MLQKFVPGLGQPLDFAAMAAGHGIGGGNPLAEALGGYRQQNTLAAAPTLGNPQAQQAQQADLAAMMEAYKAAQGQQALGESMMTPEYVQNSGALGALAMIAQAAAGHKLAKDATKTATERASEIFAEEQRREQEKAAAAQAAKLAEEQRAFDRALLLETEKGRIRNERTPDAVRTLEVLAQHPELAAIDRSRRAAGASRTSITMPGQNAFDRELGKADAQTYVQLRNRAGEAQQALNQLSNVEEILSLQQTGRMQEAMALAGQYFGTEAGANMQALRGAIQPLVLAQVKQLGTGAGITDADRKFIEDGMPGFGNDPRANQRVVRIMRQSAEANINLFGEAEKFRQQNGTLVGFNPAAVLRPAPPSGFDSGTPQPVAPRATNPQTGETMEYRNGQWVKVQ